MKKDALAMWRTLADMETELRERMRDERYYTALAQDYLRELQHDVLALMSKLDQREV